MVSLFALGISPANAQSVASPSPNAIKEAQALVDLGNPTLIKSGQPLVRPDQSVTDALRERYDAELVLIAARQSSPQLVRPMAAASSLYHRTCTVNFGSGNTQPWDVQQAYNCAGTLKYYYNGSYSGFLNMVRYLAVHSQNRTAENYRNLQNWCRDNSFSCGLVLVVLGGPVSFVFGAISG